MQKFTPTPPCKAVVTRAAFSRCGLVSGEARRAGAGG